jgi:hypothetical protein
MRSSVTTLPGNGRYRLGRESTHLLHTRSETALGTFTLIVSVPNIASGNAARTAKILVDHGKSVTNSRSRTVDHEHGARLGREIRSADERGVQSGRST